jgi:hypothetical protein
MLIRSTSPLALMKLTSSSSRPGAATPAVIGQSVATSAIEAATPRRQKAWVRARSAAGSASSTLFMVSPENTVSSTTASDRQSPMPSSWLARLARSVLTR